MSAPITPALSTSRLSGLLGFLQQDPENLNLLEDAASCAYDEGAFDEAAALMERYGALRALTPAQQNFTGLAALKTRDFLRASEIFERLHAAHPLDGTLRFNLAWAKSGLEDYQAASDLLDNQPALAVSGAAALKIHALHHLGLLEEALTLGQKLAGERPDDKGLMGALSLVAADAEDMESARKYASLAGDNPDGASTLALLMLNDNKIDESLALFEQALGRQPGNPRALLGKGLGLLINGKAEDAASYIDHAAEGFETHLGSWVSAGWAHFVHGDHAASRVRFERALQIDDTFAETHGALAVLDIMDGNLDGARRRVDVALRLDRQCLSAALAKSLLLTGGGHTKSAEKVRAIAMNLPIGANGQTIAEAIATYGSVWTKGAKT